MWKKGLILQFSFIIFLLISFVIGAYLYSARDLKTLIQASLHQTETFENSGSPSPAPSPSPSEMKDDCPSALIKRGQEYHLYLGNVPEQPGTNPLVFKDLGEYDAYLETQRAKGINCPVLFVQEEFNAQNEPVYRVQQDGVPSLSQSAQGWTKSILNPTSQSIFAERKDATRANPPYNKDNYAGFDPYGLYVGRKTDLDTLAETPETEQVSDNPMDPNWGGVMYTQQLVDAGKFKDNVVSRPNLYTPKTQFIPMLNNGLPQPPFP